MAMFAAFHVAGSGLLATRKWLDAVSDNLANINNVSATSGEAYRERFVMARPASDGNGAEVAGMRSFHFIGNANELEATIRLLS